MDSDSSFVTLIIVMVVVAVLGMVAKWAFLIFLGMKAVKYMRNFDKQIPTIQQQLTQFNTMSAQQQQMTRPEIIAMLDRMNSQRGKLDAIHRQQYEARVGELQGMAANAGIDWNPESGFGQRSSEAPVRPIIPALEPPLGWTPLIQRPTPSLPPSNPPTTESPRISPDAVRFTVLAPSRVKRGTSFRLEVLAHESHAKWQIPRDFQIRSAGPYPIVSGTSMTMRVTIPTLGFDDAEVMVWLRQTGAALFLVNVSDESRFGEHVGSVEVTVSGLRIARIPFSIDVGESVAEPRSVNDSPTFVRSAFASYASEDRERVLGRVQGMEKVVPSIDIYLDVLSNRSGENWKQRIELEIAKRDTFYLFWSTFARQSTEVEHEWRFALSHRGEDFIDPVPLDPPDKAPPPKELSHKHFSDRMMLNR
jgi:hypothetical protein